MNRVRCTSIKGVRRELLSGDFLRDRHTVFSRRARHNLRALSPPLMRSHYDAFVSALAARFTHADSVELVQPERGADEPEQNPDERQYAGPPV